MNTYHAFFHGKQIEVEAETSYDAQKKAVEIFKAKKSYQVTVVVVAVDGKQVSHNTAEID